MRQKWTAGIYKQLSGVHYEKFIPLWSIIFRERNGELASFHSEEEISAVLKQWDQKMDTGLWMGLVAYSKLELKIF